MQKFVLVWKHIKDPNEEDILAIEQFFEENLEMGCILDKLPSAFIIEGEAKNLQMAYANNADWELAPERPISMNTIRSFHAPH